MRRRLFQDVVSVCHSNTITIVMKNNTRVDYAAIATVSRLRKKFATEGKRNVVNEGGGKGLMAALFKVAW